MLAFDYYSPTKFIFGRGRENEVGRYVIEYGGSHVLLVYGGHSAERSGLLGRIEASLQESGLTSVRFGGVAPNPIKSKVDDGIELARRERIDFVLAIGGGSAIDTAKAIAAGVPYPGDFWDFFTGADPDTALSIGTVLTIASAGSEGSPNAIITNPETLEKATADNALLRPKFSILNPELTYSLSPFQTACGISDILSHALERYFSNTPDVGVNDRLLEAIMLSVLEEAPRAMQNPSDYGARANLMWAAMVCNNDILGVGRRSDWNTHIIEHVLSAKYNIIHAAGISVLTPAWLKYVLEHHSPERLAGWAERVFAIEPDPSDPAATARAGIVALEQFLGDLGMPLRLADLAVPREDFDEIVRLVGFGQTGRDGFVRLNDQAVRDILELAAE